ncbi:MAG: ATP-binding cassette domain-containing protein [Desulfobacterales bacterium]|jgi:phospholipid/cholesterol/gamma-HCH transport system ATP-binding protein
MNLPLIQFKDAAKHFGNNFVLDGVNLSIFKGEITAIIGKSGTGKSVLLKHIIGLFEPDSGDVLYEGRSLMAMSNNEKRTLKRKSSYMFQDSALFDFLTVYENIALPLKERTSLPEAEIQRRVRDKMHQLDLHKIDDKYPSQISGGMKKRVALARALVTDPEIVLFDEPTTGLDPIRKNAVHAMISDYQKRFGFTAVIVSHEIPDVFFISQRIAMIENGKILFEGLPDDIQRASDPLVKNFIQGLESPHDDLTGIASQASGQRRLKQEMNRLQRHKIPFSIILLSVEKLEDLDRIVGHMASQAVFKSFANHVKQNIYITDTCFRYDMNKIMVVLPDTDANQAEMFCQKLSRNLDGNLLLEEPESLHGFCFSVNAGIAQAREDSRLASLLGEAEATQNIFYECKL